MDPVGTYIEGGAALEAEPEDLALKFLVTNNAAGSIIGKGGATINQLQEQSSARIKVANSSDFFPGTSERCVLITGNQNALLCAASLVVMKMQEAEQGRDGSVDMGTPFTAKMLVPNTAVGGLIGKGGATINDMSARCGAQMKVSSKDSSAMIGLSERVVSVTGDLNQMNIAINLVANKMQETPSAAEYTNMTTSYKGARSGMMSMGAIPVAVPGSPSGKETTVTISVLDSLAGFVVGKEGTALREIQRQSGARIVMSRRGEYIPGTQSRSVTISGSASSVQAAQMLVASKVQQAAIKDVTGMHAVAAIEDSDD